MVRFLKKLKNSVTSGVATIGGAASAAMLIATILVIMAGYLSNLPSILLGNIVDSIVIENDSKDVWIAFGLIVACLLGRVVLVVTQKYIVEKVAVKLKKRVFLDNIDKVLSVRVDALQHLRAGETTLRLDKKIHGTVKLLKLLFLEALPQIAIAIPAVILTFSQDAAAGVVLICVMILSAVVTSFQIRSQKGIRISLINISSGLAGHVAELLGNLPYVRASGLGTRIKLYFAEQAEDLRSVEFLHHKWMMSFDAIKSFLEDGGLAIVVGVGIYQVANDVMTPGTILTLAMLYKSAAVPLQNLHRIIDEAYESFLQIDAASEIDQAKDDHGLAGTEVPKVDNLDEVLNVSSLSLSRENTSGQKKLILDNVSFIAKPGEVIGIAGPSGGGKTTLLNVILGLLSDYEGSLNLFGKEVRELSKVSLADFIGYAPQKPYVRQADVRTNLTEGVLSTGVLSDEVLFNALSKASLDFDLGKMLTERADNISPGQAQRLSLARIFAKQKAKLVVLDEATSMLDGQTQSDIMDELKNHSKDRVTLMVAHRLDTLKWADRIIVLNEGKIVQVGSYSELLAQPGVFSTLAGVSIDTDVNNLVAAE